MDMKRHMINFFSISINMDMEKSEVVIKWRKLLRKK
jgi:hypothetical protein